MIECLHILCDLFPALSLTFKIVPCRQIIPARSAGRLRVRDDDAHVLPEQIIPVLNVLRIVLAHQKNNRRCVRGAFQIELIRKTVLDQSRIRNHLHIPLQCQRRHIRLQAVRHLKRLLARTSMRLYHRHILPGLLLPVIRKQCIVRFVQFSGRIVRDVCNLHFLCVCGIRCRLPVAAHDSRRKGCCEKCCHGFSAVSVLFSIHYLFSYRERRLKDAVPCALNLPLYGQFLLCLAALYHKRILVVTAVSVSQCCLVICVEEILLAECLDLLIDPV